MYAAFFELIFKLELQFSWNTVIKWIMRIEKGFKAGLHHLHNDEHSNQTHL